MTDNQINTGLPGDITEEITRYYEVDCGSDLAEKCQGGLDSESYGGDVFSVAEFEIALEAEGWVKDPDDGWICEACAAAKASKQGGESQDTSGTTDQNEGA